MLFFLWFVINPILLLVTFIMGLLLPFSVILSVGILLSCFIFFILALPHINYYLLETLLGKNIAIRIINCQEIMGLLKETNLSSLPKQLQVCIIPSPLFKPIFFYPSWIGETIVLCNKIQDISHTPKTSRLRSSFNLFYVLSSNVFFGYLNSFLLPHPKSTLRLFIKIIISLLFIFLKPPPLFRG